MEENYNNEQNSLNTVEENEQYNYSYNNTDYDYGQPQNYNQQENDNEVMSVGEWLLTILVTIIPCLGLVLYLVWAFGKNENVNRRNYCKAWLIYWLIQTILIIIILIVVFAILIPSSSQYYYY
ncbi:hypothetical protein [Faecalimonas sp.]